MKTTQRFHVQRSKALEKVFFVKSLVNVWREVVRRQLRTQEILDLHDYYDFNFNIEEKCNSIQQQILSGQYRAKPPLIYKLEKKYGVCRHMMLPAPSDALVLQTIIEKSLSKGILEAQPTTKAYYSRDKHSLKLPHQFQGAEYSWHIKWKRFQQEIWNFGKQCDFLVVTDLANYYDNIGLRELRHVISSRVSVPEVILDLLFNIIEQLSWVPDYLPSSLKGLPTINLEASRILAHSLLFEIDEILNERTGECFVRWMDDINFGVDSFDKACETLGMINDVLKSRGLSLNLGKTYIYTSEDVKKHFLVDENQYLDLVKLKDFESDEERQNIVDDLYKSFESHKSKRHLKNWDKVTKRFLTAFGKLCSKKILDEAKILFLNNPGIRRNVSYYLSELGFSSETSIVVLEILNEAKNYDDVILFYLTKLLTDWQIPNNENGTKFIEEIYITIQKVNKPFTFYCALWFAAKYKKPKEIIVLIQGKKSLWSYDHFLRRQVISVIPRILSYKPEFCQKMLADELSSGMEDSTSVAANINYLGKL